MKWLPVVVLGIIGVLAAIVCVEYLTVSIHALPSFIPGQRPVNGHYHVRGAFAGLVAVVALAGAVVLALRIVRPAKEKPVQTDQPVAAPSTADLLSGPVAAPESTDGQ
jgi:hypothetical protein